MLTCDLVAEFGEGYALCALEPDELGQMEQHLERCPACRERMAHDVETAALLALAVPQREPPPSLKRSIMTAARDEPVVTPPRSSWPRRLFPSPTRAAWGAAAFASLAFAVALGWALNLQAQLAARPTAPLAAPAAASLGDDYGAMLQRAQMHRLTGSETAPDARGWIYADPGDASGLLVAYRLPPLPPDRAYQLWLVAPGQQRFSGGVFTVDGEGYGWLKVRAPQPFASLQRVGITIEPRTGSPGPTGARVLGGEL